MLGLFAGCLIGRVGTAPVFAPPADITVVAMLPPNVGPLYAGQSLADMADYAAMVDPGNFSASPALVVDVSVAFTGAITAADDLLAEGDAAGFIVTVTDSVGGTHVFDAGQTVAVAPPADITVVAMLPPNVGPLYAGQSLADMADYAAMVEPGNFNASPALIADVSVAFTGAITAADDLLVEGDIAGFIVTVTDNVGGTHVFDAGQTVTLYKVRVEDTGANEARIDINPIVPDNESVTVVTNGIDHTQTKSEWEGQTLNLVAPTIVADLLNDPVFSIDIGIWSTPTGALGYAYQWKRNGANISGATSTTFDSTGEEGNTISVEVTGDDGVNTPLAVTTAGIDMPAGSTVKTYSFAASGEHRTSDQNDITGIIPAGLPAENKYIYLLVGYRLVAAELPGVDIGGTALTVPEASHLGGAAQTAIYRFDASAGGDFALTLSSDNGNNWRGAAWAAYVVDGDTLGVKASETDNAGNGSQLDVSSNLKADNLILACFIGQNEGEGRSPIGMTEDQKFGSPIWHSTQAAMFYSHLATIDETPRAMTVEPGTGSNGDCSATLVVIG